MLWFSASSTTAASLRTSDQRPSMSRMKWRPTVTRCSPQSQAEAVAVLLSSISPTLLPNQPSQADVREIRVQTQHQVSQILGKFLIAFSNRCGRLLTSPGSDSGLQTHG